ncbi:PREDICTED: ATP-dependent RNA helicase DDX51 [Nicrophorus vespilloides]|uniref:ATP-dependent RNA helicase n=1 Tax=Nicrophorus vespilloides TaxID=110193 RepID=A0ABM1MKW4_NICVS|nr:PREDICTED: ATP-dependent RNA helicase DDX51 [Nicrophorus vespilloides]
MDVGDTLFQIQRYIESDEEFELNTDQNLKQHLKRVKQNLVDIEDVETSDKEDNGNEEEVEGFTVLGKAEFKKKQQVKRVLPKWITEPELISKDLQNLTVDISSITQLDPYLIEKLKELGITYFFPVQVAVIEWLLRNEKMNYFYRPRDICVTAPTGSGKSLAFILPVVHSLLKYRTKKIRALIVTPTNILAKQLCLTLNHFIKDTHLTALCNSSYEDEKRLLVASDPIYGHINKVDIYVTSGDRLIEHLKYSKGFDLSHLEYLVLDEADILLHTSNWLIYLEKHISMNSKTVLHNNLLNVDTLKTKNHIQKLLFSATLTYDPEMLEAVDLFQPKLFSASTFKEDKPQFSLPMELKNKYVECEDADAPLMLYKLIVDRNLKRTMVFANSKEDVVKLTNLLKLFFADQKKSISNIVHEDKKTQSRVLRDFQDGSIDILVGTDLLCRGMDFGEVNCIISYHAPKVVQTYVHRAGRTARAGKEGLALTIASGQHAEKFKSFVRSNIPSLKQIKIPDDQLTDLRPRYEEVLGQLHERIREEHQLEREKRKELYVDHRKRMKK